MRVITVVTASFSGRDPAGSHAHTDGAVIQLRGLAIPIVFDCSMPEDSRQRLGNRRLQRCLGWIGKPLRDGLRIEGFKLTNSPLNTLYVLALFLNGVKR